MVKRECMRFVSILLILGTIGSMFLGWIVEEGSTPESRRETARMELEGMILDEVRTDEKIIPEEELSSYYAIAEWSGYGPYTIVFTSGKLLKYGYDMIETTITHANPEHRAALIKLYQESLVIRAVASAAVFWVIILLLISLIVRHLLGRKGKGYFALLMVSAVFVLFTLTMMDTAAQMVFTPWGFVALGALLASIILWGRLCAVSGGAPGPVSFRHKIRCGNCGAQMDATAFDCPQCGAFRE